MYVFISVDTYTTVHNDTEETMSYHNSASKLTVVDVIVPTLNNVNNRKE